MIFFHKIKLFFRALISQYSKYKGNWITYIAVNFNFICATEIYRQSYFSSGTCRLYFCTVGYCLVYKEL